MILRFFHWFPSLLPLAGWLFSHYVISIYAFLSFLSLSLFDWLAFRCRHCHSSILPYDYHCCYLRHYFRHWYAHFVSPLLFSFIISLVVLRHPYYISPYVYVWKIFSFSFSSFHYATLSFPFFHAIITIGFSSLICHFPCSHVISFSCLLDYFSPPLRLIIVFFIIFPSSFSLIFSFFMPIIISRLMFSFFFSSFFIDYQYHYLFDYWYLPCPRRLIAITPLLSFFLPSCHWPPPSLFTPDYYWYYYMLIISPFSSFHFINIDYYWLFSFSLAFHYLLFHYFSPFSILFPRRLSYTSIDISAFLLASRNNTCAYWCRRLRHVTLSSSLCHARPPRFLHTWYASLLFSSSLLSLITPLYWLIVITGFVFHFLRLSLRHAIVIIAFHFILNILLLIFSPCLSFHFRACH